LPKVCDFINEETEYPGAEYSHLHPMIGNLMTVIRMSLGDNDFVAVSKFFMKAEISSVFWIIWFFIMFLNCIVFLNFIIAEACAIYERVSGDINNILMHQKLNLVNESEDMASAISKASINNPIKNPKYLIKRELE